MSDLDIAKIKRIKERVGAVMFQRACKLLRKLDSEGVNLSEQYPVVKLNFPMFEQWEIETLLMTPEGWE